MNDDALPNLAEGIPLAQVPDGGLMTGRVGDEDVLLVRRGDAIAAVGAHCTHYHGPLADGLVVGDTIRCPWHHACFSLSTGEALGAPALDPIACWHVERRGDLVLVREKQPAPVARTPVTSPSSIVIVGGGAAGLAAADMLRRDGYSGPLTMISADESAPCDRPNLSKDFLAGTAQEDWIPLRPDEFYRERQIDLILNARVTSIDTRERRVRLENGTSYPFGALLIATGADPVRLTIPGEPSIDVRYLRTFADSRAIVSRAESARRVLVIGASFIGLEVAASLRARGIDVHVVAPEHQPLERVLGAEAGRFIRAVHESQGVTFHLGTTVTRIDGRTAVLGDGTTVDADLVVAGVGVRPSVALAEQAGLAMDRGILVDEHLETSVPGIYAAGDVARWPDPHGGSRIRVEHWVVAERQGQAAAKNMLGARRRFDEVPFFWSQHFDVVINYVGHAETWDAIAIDGSLDARDCTITYRLGGKTLAVATIGRDHASLEAEAAMQASTA
jgi:NADPH-dependent 2,4-dienoyl-CoA reductase/sulfur reductase-like enzyme/nitrite reductase/ring-hydroxylating ferredoxin subunit